MARIKDLLATKRSPPSENSLRQCGTERMARDGRVGDPMLRREDPCRGLPMVIHALRPTCSATLAWATERIGLAHLTHCQHWHPQGPSRQIGAKGFDCLLPLYLCRWAPALSFRAAASSNMLLDDLACATAWPDCGVCRCGCIAPGAWPAVKAGVRPHVSVGLERNRAVTKRCALWPAKPNPTRLS